jgi:hypothetical protein
MMGMSKEKAQKKAKKELEEEAAKHQKERYAKIDVSPLAHSSRTPLPILTVAVPRPSKLNRKQRGTALRRHKNTATRVGPHSPPTTRRPACWPDATGPTP